MCVLLHQDHNSSLSVKGSHGDKKIKDRHETGRGGDTTGSLFCLSTALGAWEPDLFGSFFGGLPAWCNKLPRVVSLVLPMAFSQHAHFSIISQGILGSRQGLLEAEG